MASLTLHIRPQVQGSAGTSKKAYESAAAPKRACEVAWLLDGKPLADPFPLAEGTVSALMDVGQEFQRFFKGPARPVAEAQALNKLGQRLFEACFQPVWKNLRSYVETAYELLISSEDGKLLSLPWELVKLAHEPIGCDTACSLRRSPFSELSRGRGATAAGPLRILFLAAAAKGMPALDYDQEEEALLRAVADRNVVVHFAETGSLDELAELVADYEPHIVHLSGHAVISEGVGQFTFEDGRGNPDKHSAAEIHARACRNDSVRCVVLNGCETAQAAVASMCQDLVRMGLPMALGWSASVADDRAAQFVETLYRYLVGGELAVPVAAAHARLKLRGPVAVQPELALLDPTFALPQVYCSTEDLSLFDSAASPQRSSRKGLRYSLIGDGIIGLTQGYVGHRRERRHLIRTLRRGDATVGIITGIPYAGKSTLATRVANHLEAAGFIVEPLRAKRGGTRAEAARDLLTRLKEVLVRAGRSQDLVQSIRNLGQDRVLIVLDRFEEVLSRETRTISDPELAKYYVYLVTHLVGDSRVLVTSQYLPADTPEGLPNLIHLPLPELEEADFRNFLHRDQKVYDLINQGVISQQMLRILYRSFGGTPGFLRTLRELLRVEQPPRLAKILESVQAANSARFSASPESSTFPPGEQQLAQSKEQYYREICPPLFASLPPHADTVLGCLALSDFPLLVEAIAAATDLSADQVIPLVQSSGAYGLVEQLVGENARPLYRIPGLLREWLARKVPPPELQKMHRKLATFWQACYEKGDDGRLGLGWSAKLTAAREHAQMGEDWPLFHWATIVLARELRERGAWQAALEILQEILVTHPSAECYLEMAKNEILLSNPNAAGENLRRAQTLSAEDPAMLAAVLHQLASLDRHEGKTRLARKKFEESRRLWHKTGNSRGEAEALTELAGIDLHEGKIADARTKLKEALEMRRGDKFAVAAIRHQLGSLYLRSREFGKAKTEFTMALAIRREGEDRAGEAATLHQLASLAWHENRPTDARWGFESALQLRRAIEDRAGQAATLHQLASMDLDEGNYAAARARFEQALEIRRALHDILGEAATLHQLGATDHHEKNYFEARKKLSRALLLRDQAGDHAGMAATLHELATLLWRKDPPELSEAKKMFAQALQEWRRVDDPLGQASTRRELGLMNANEDPWAACTQLQKALALSQDNQGENQEQEVLQDLAHLAYRLNFVEDAAVLLEMSRMLRGKLGKVQTDQEFRKVISFEFQLPFTGEELEKLRLQAEVAYQKDRGRSFIRRVFSPKRRREAAVASRRDVPLPSHVVVSDKPSRRGKKI